MSGAEMSKAGQGATGKVDCFGLPVWRAKLQEVHKSLYWGGGIYGDPDGREGDFNRALARFTLMGSKCPECRASEFVGMVPAADRNADTFKAYCNWHRQQRPDEYDLHETPSAALVARRCAVIRNAYETGGAEDAEPLWFGILKCTAAMEPNISVEVSDGHPKFRIDELADRLGRIEREHVKPATCAFLSRYSSECRTCEWSGRINSPMALAYERLPKVQGVTP